MSASQSGVFNTQQFTDMGDPLVGGRLYTYAFGTTTFKAAYTDHAGAIPHTYTSDGLSGQFIALDVRGELPAPLYLVGGSYDLALKTAAGATVWTRRADPVWDITSDLSEASGASLVGVDLATIPAAINTIDWAIKTSGDGFNVLRLIPPSEWTGIINKTYTYDCTAAFNAAFVASLNVLAPSGGYRIDGVVRIKRTGSTLRGSGWSSTVLFGADNFSADPAPNPIISVKSDDWETLGTRIADINISDLTLTGRSGATLSNRDLLGMFGVGYECNVSRVHFDGSQRRAIYAKDLWDTLFHGCRITHCGYSNTNHHAVMLDGDVGNSNAVRFIGGHFESNPTGSVLMRGTTNQIFFIGNKFEGENNDASYLDFHVMHAEAGCSNIIFSTNTVTSNQKNPSKHWMYSGATSTQITGGTFQCANDLLGACLLKFEGPASLIGSKVVGASFYADGSTAEYPFDLGGSVVFQANTVNVVNPRKLFKVANGSTVSDNTVVGKGTVNQVGDVFCYFSGSLSSVKDNHISNTTSTVANNLTANFNEPKSEIAFVDVVSGFDPNQYRTDTVFQATAPITTIVASYNSKTISIKCGGANTLTHNSANSIVLASAANFAPGSWGLITLVWVTGIGWVEKGRMTWF